MEVSSTHLSCGDPGGGGPERELEDDERGDTGAHQGQQDSQAPEVEGCPPLLCQRSAARGGTLLRLLFTIRITIHRQQAH